MITREHQERRQSTVVVTAVTCDRCGEPIRKGSGFVRSDYPFEGTYIRGTFFAPSGNAAEIELVESELCAACSRELVEWIGGGAHVGLKARDLVENV